MTEDELIAASDANYYASWRLIAEAAGGVSRDEGGVLIAAPGFLPMWVNIVFVTRPPSDPEAQLGAAFTMLDEHEIPFLVRIREGLDAASERAAKRLGLRYTDSIPGMTLAPIRSGPERDIALDVRQVADDATFEDFVGITAASFEFESEAARRMMPPGLWRTPDTYWYVGYAEGKPVAASGLVVVDGVAGVNFIGTLADYRGRGFGEAMTWRVVVKGAELGCRVAALQASEMGRPVYERMGFQVVTQYKTFVRQQWL